MLKWHRLSQKVWSLCSCNFHPGLLQLHLELGTQLSTCPLAHPISSNFTDKETL